MDFSRPVGLCIPEGMSVLGSRLPLEGTALLAFEILGFPIEGRLGSWGKMEVVALQGYYHIGSIGECGSIFESGFKPIGGNGVAKPDLAPG